MARLSKLSKRKGKVGKRGRLAKTLHGFKSSRVSALRKAARRPSY